MPKDSSCMHDIWKSMADRNRMLKKARKSKLIEDWNIYKRLRNTCNSKLKSAKSAFQRNLLEQNSLNPWKFWQTIKKLLPFQKTVSANDGNSSNRETLQNQAQNFSKYFSTVVSELKERSIKLMDFVWKYPKRLTSRTSNAFKIQNVSNAFVLKELKKLKRNKANGVDDLPAGMLRDCYGHILIDSFKLYVFSLSLNTSILHWKTYFSINYSCKIHIKFK